MNVLDIHQWINHSHRGTGIFRDNSVITVTAHDPAM